MFCARGRAIVVTLQPLVVCQDFDIHLNDTVTHEVAHYGIHCAFPTRRRIKPHGAEWRGLMRALGANPQATFSSDMTAFGYDGSADLAILATVNSTRYRRRATTGFSANGRCIAAVFVDAELCQSASS